MTWIKCSERMPGPTVKVLSFGSGSVDCGWREEGFDGTSKWYWGSSEPVWGDVTHWMPLPEAPTP